MMISKIMSLSFAHSVKVLKHLEKQIGDKDSLFGKGIPYAEGHMLCSSKNYVLIIPKTARRIHLSEFKADSGAEGFIKGSLIVAYQLVRVIS